MSSHEQSLLLQQTETGQGAAHTLPFIILLSSEVQIGLKPSSQCAFWQSCSLPTNSTRLTINLLLSNHGRLGQHKATQLNATTRDAQEIPMYWNCLYLSESLQIEKMFGVENVILPLLVCVEFRACRECSSGYLTWLAEVIKRQCSIPAFRTVWCLCLSPSSVIFLSSEERLISLPSPHTYPAVTTLSYRISSIIFKKVHC